MAITDEIIRIKQAKDEIRTSIEATGTVTVGTGTIDTYPAKIQELVQSLQGGGSTSGCNEFYIANDYASFASPLPSIFTKLDVSNFDTSNLTNLNGFFSEMRYLIILDLSSWNTTNINSMSATFSGCLSLKELDLSSFTLDSNIQYLNKATFTNVPRDCLIYVKDQASKDFLLSKVTDFTNVQVKE